MLMVLIGIAAGACYFLADFLQHPVDVMPLEHEWVTAPNREPLWPVDGARVRKGEPILKIGKIAGRSRISWVVWPDGIMGSTWNFGFDAGGDSRDKPLLPAGLASLRGNLKKLPPSHSNIHKNKWLVIAWPEHGLWGSYWIVRHYHLDDVPPEADALAASLKLQIAGFNDSEVTRFSPAKPAEK